MIDHIFWMPGLLLYRSTLSTYQPLGWLSYLRSLTLDWHSRLRRGEGWGGGEQAGRLNIA